MVGKPFKGMEPIGEGTLFHEGTEISFTSNKIQTPKTSNWEKMLDEDVNGPQGLVTFYFSI